MQGGKRSGRQLATLGRSFYAAQYPNPNGPVPPASTIAGTVHHPAFGGDEIRYTSEPRPAGNDDEAGTAQTVARMIEYSTADCADPLVMAAAADAIAGRRDQVQQVGGVFDWLRRHLQYVEDKELAFFRPIPEDDEVLIRPADLVRMPQPMGDCDEFTMAGRAMLRAAGIRSAIKTVEADDDAPGCYSHVYLIAYPAAGAIAFDAIPTGHGLGWEATPTGKVRVWKEPMIRTLGSNTTTLDYPPAGLDNGIPTGIVGADVSAPDSPGFDWGGFAGSLTKDAAGILGTRYGVPQLNPGQVIRKADGTLLYQAAPGQAPPFGSSLFSGGSGGSSSVLLIGVVVVIGFAIAMKGSKS
jgi:hypothetical protein